MKLEKGKRTIINMLDYAADKFADFNYATHKTNNGWEHFTYREIRDYSNAIAASLLKAGLNPGDNAAILSEGSPMWVIAEYGLLTIGAVSIPLSVKLLPEELPYRLNHSEAKAIYVSKNNLDKVLGILDKIDNQSLKLIYLSDDVDNFRNKIKKAGAKPDCGFSFWEMLEEGKKYFKEAPENVMDLRNNIKENDVVNISYTSGTTGNPKGIMLTHLNYYSNARDGVSVFKLKEGFRTLIILPVDHCFAHTVALYGALFKGLDLNFLDTRGGITSALKNIPINLKEIKPEFLLTVPALTGNFMNKMIEGVKAKGDFIYSIFDNGLKAGCFRNGNGYTKPGGLKQFTSFFPYKLADTLIFKKLTDVFGGELQFMVGGGALLDIKQQQFYTTIGTPVYQGYGLTEAAPIISSNTPFNHKMGTSGDLMPGVTCKIMDDDVNEATKGKIGEIVIKGDNVMKGYYKNEDATRKVIKDGWLWTGDLGYLDEDGFLVVTGRNKALLISADGEKYSPESIEEAMVNSSEYIAQAVIHNNQNKFTSAIVTIDPLKIRHLKNKPINEVYSKIKQEVNAFKKDPAYKNQFPSKWTPSQFYIAPEPFTEQNKMVNSTLKMVRYKITESYEQQIDAMYQSGGAEKIDHLNEESLNKILK
jgi:long-chain acyl-CoA synthetase